MLTLKNIHKKYYTNESSVEALKGISISFRKSEFVSILGPSGGGKTTLLNIIGGLDHYTEGDLIIDGRSTHAYDDRDWDTYRNHRIGFVFQSYNLIPHQNVLSNVELALTLSGVGKTERRERAIKALESVGLGDQVKKKPSEMSGGQMQRVAIARALVNDPDILLADEPTGALDTQTSLQVMDLLKEIAKDRLVIMVTHNPEIAEKYSTRIVNLRDGEITGDSDPYEPEEKEPEKRSAEKHHTMSFLTALSLSLNNLLTKKTRTILTAVAGSIGIIGIALILSLSTGINNYIDDIQRDAMDSFPLTVDKQAFDLSSLMSSMPTNTTKKKDHEKGKVYSNTAMVQQASAMSGSMKQNNVDKFKKYLDNPSSDIRKYLGKSGVVYSYNASFDIFAYDDDGVLLNTDGTTFVNDNAAAKIMMNNDLFSVDDMMDMVNNSGSVANYVNCFVQLSSKPDGTGISDSVTTQYDLVYGNWPKEYNEVVLALDANGEVMSNYLYMMGLLPSSQYNEIMKKVQAGEKVVEKVESWKYEDICKKEFYLLPSCDQYQKNKDGYYDYLGVSENAIKKLTKDKAIKLKISGIIQIKNDNVAIPTIPAVGYTKALSDHVINYTSESQIVKDQLANKKVNVLSGKEFSKEQGNLLAKLVPAMAAMMPEKSYEGNLSKLGVVDEDSPTSIAIYADSFEDKENIIKCIDKYNDSVEDEDQITYTDYVGMIMSSVSSIIKAVSYVLMGFVGVSLVVSSIMIGIITYISVLERKKEIGILRAIGASKRDISNVFNAETFIVGLIAGLFGVGFTGALLIPINAVLHKVLENVIVSAAFPTKGAIILVILSIVLTLIAGLIPAKIASRKDPVEALRSE